MGGYPSVKKGNKIGEKSKRPHAGIPLDKKIIAELVVKYTGNLSRVADAMGSSRGCVRRVIDNDEELRQLLTDCRERWIDDIEESVLARAHESHDTALQCFVLKTQARHRGWDQDESKNTAKDIATAAFDFIVSKSKTTNTP